MADHHPWACAAWWPCAGSSCLRRAPAPDGALRVFFSGSGCAPVQAPLPLLPLLLLAPQRVLRSGVASAGGGGSKTGFRQLAALRCLPQDVGFRRRGFSVGNALEFGNRFGAHGYGHSFRRRPVKTGKTLQIPLRSRCSRSQPSRCAWWRRSSNPRKPACRSSKRASALRIAWRTWRR